MRRNSGIIGPKITTATGAAPGVHDLFDNYNAKKLNEWPITKKVTNVSNDNGTNLNENVINTITINTEGFANGHTLYYSIVTVSGPTLTGADFDSGSLTGSFNISSGVGTFTVKPLGDDLAENNTCKIQIRKDSVSGTILGETAVLTITDAAAPTETILRYTTGNIVSWMNTRTKHATNTGFDSSGMWINGNANSTSNSYPIVTNESFSSSQTSLTIKFVANKIVNCSDHGFCIFKTGTSPSWNWGIHTSRIAFQWNCSSPNWYPATGSGSGNISGASTHPQIYYVTITMDLATGAITTIVETGSFGGSQAINYSGTLSGAKLSELNGWSSSDTWEVGFDADEDTTSNKSYFSDITITVPN